MFAKDLQIEIDTQQLAVIEAALHTQSKILCVQAGAGGKAARDQLNTVKQVLAQIDAQKPVRHKPSRARWLSGFGMKRIFG